MLYCLRYIHPTIGIRHVYIILADRNYISVVAIIMMFIDVRTNRFLYCTLPNDIIFDIEEKKQLTIMAQSRLSLCLFN